MNITTIRLLIKIKNASLSKIDYVYLTVNLFGLIIIKELYKSGIIQNYQIKNNKIKVFIRYVFNTCVIKTLKFLSTSSKKNYFSYISLYNFSTQNIILYVSTSKGIFTHIECQKRKLGGTLLFLC